MGRIKDNLKAGIQRLIAWALRHRTVRALLLYQDQRGSMLADSVTYRALFSIFAGVLLGFSVVALWLGGNPEAMQSLTESLERVVPGIGQLINVEQIHAPATFTVTGVISLLVLVSAAMSAITSLRKSMRMLADDVSADVSFIKVLMRNLALAIGIGVLLLSAAAATYIGALGISRVSGWFGGDDRNGIFNVLIQIVTILIVFILDVVLIALSFRLLSGVQAPARVLWTGSAIGGIGLMVLQQFSGLFVRGATSNPLLASFAALIALLLWVNLSTQVILLASSWMITGTRETRDRVRYVHGADTLEEWHKQRAKDRYEVATQELRAAQEANQTS